MLTRRFAILAALVTLTGCGLDRQEAPSLTGPSELGLSLTLSLDRDVISQDGQSQAKLSVTARDGYGQAVKGLSLRVGITVDGNAVDYGTLATRIISTDLEGHASVMYTAPAEPPASVNADTSVTLTVTPIGSNYASELPRKVVIRLTRPGIISAPTNELKPTFTIGGSAPKIGDPIAFDATASTAESRTIVSYQWTFGDGGSATGKLTSHTYHSAGTFVITLTITDDLGRSASTSQPLSLETNLPKADFVASPTDPLVSEDIVFNARTSTPGTGRTIVGYSWDFGDGSGTSGATATHSFNQARTYTVVLTVEDDLGQTSSTSKTIAVGDLTVIFTISPTSPKLSGGNATVSFNAAGTKVAAGATITSYTWDFGDPGSPGTETGGPSKQHTYHTEDTFTVILTIQDSRGHVGTASQTVTVAAP